MPNIDDVLKKHGQQIADESNQFQSVLQNEVPRDPVRRPWSGLDEKVEIIGDTPPEPRVPADAWYNSWRSIATVLKLRRKSISITLFVTLATLVFIAQYVPSTYNSALHLYAPEKSDTIASRMPLFSNRVEFASFPVDSKIPLALVARRLKSDSARSWVIEQYRKRQFGSPVELNPDSVASDTFYAEGSELLVIAGYANDPQIAADVTNLYWDYLEEELQKIQIAHIEKIDQWIDLTTTDLNRRMTELAKELMQVSARRPVEAKSQVYAKLAETYADLEIKRLRALKEQDEFQIALKHPQSDEIWLVSNPEIQDLRQIHDAIKGEVGTTEAQRQDIEARALSLAKSLLSEKEREVQSIEEQTQKLKAQLNVFRGDEGIDSQYSRTKELLRQQSAYQAQADELDRLRTQLKVESAMRHSRLRAIQAASPDPASRRPRLVLKYSVCFLLALFFSVIFLMVTQRRRSIWRTRERRGQRFADSYPHSTIEAGLDL